MKFFIDTADLDEIRELCDTGLVDGVTTNPTLAAKSGRKFLDLVKEICDIVAGPVSAEVTALDFPTMMKEADVLRRIAPNVAVKVPLTPDGLKTCRAIADDGGLVNVTLCFSTNQALLAAKAGAAFVSPFVGRLDDIGHDGMGLIAEIAEVYGNYPDLTTEILAASIRHPMHVADAARIGAHVATMPPKVLRQMFDHPLTEKGLKGFMDDWAKSGQTILGA
ncbi:MAG: transaldolase [Rhodospirillaceae bacterium BRH_c57]|nr:MAG: transaldolase [Rhodospirillaceae bacterium BRH_c57]